jgi:hypothetical protein
MVVATENYITKTKSITVFLIKKYIIIRFMQISQ